MSEPPLAPRRPVLHSAHGVDRVDDYAWLRDADDPQTSAYLAAERAHYETGTAHLASLRSALALELVRRTALADRSVSWRRGGLVYYTETAEGEEYARIYRFDTRSEQALLVLDPNSLVPEGAYLGLGMVEPSPDGRLLAYSIDRTGGEDYELRFRDLVTGADRPDVVPHSYYSGAWSADSGSFFYTVLDPTYRPDQVRRHVLGTPSEADTVVLTEPDQRFELTVGASRDDGWVLITAASRDTTEVYLVPADAPAESPRSVARRRRGVEYSVELLPGGWDGAGDDRLLLVTNRHEPEFAVMQAPLPRPGAAGDPSSWQPAGSHRTGERVESVTVLAAHVVVEVRAGVEPFLRVHSRPSELQDDGHEIRCPLAFGQSRLWCAREYAAGSVTVVEQNLVTPPVWVEVDLDTGARRELKRTAVPGTDLARYATARIEAPSAGGASVPVTLAYRADLVGGLAPGRGGDFGPMKDGGHPGVLYGYGAYESSSWPEFEVGTLSLLDRGVVYAVAHVRGGGERGRGWWLDGRLRSKQNTFTDFVAARDALVAGGWTAGSRVASRGLSAGGLLQGAVFSQAPDRWAAVVAEVPFVDVVTTMSDPSVPLTVNEWDEWGDPLHSADDFAAMLAYSPYDNPPESPRPALLVTGAVNDPRVLVHEPAKWVARLRATDPDRGAGRLFLRIESGAGSHVGPSGRFAHLDYEAEILAWLLDRLGAAHLP